MLTRVRIKSHDHLNKHRKAFDRIQHPFMIKILIKVDVERTYLNIIKVTTINSQLTSLSGKKLKAFLKIQEQDKDTLSCQFY